MKHLAVGQLVSDVIGGGWGDEDPTDGTTEVRVIRGADFPDVMIQHGSSLPTRYEEPKRAANRLLQPGDIVLEVSGGTKDRPTGRVVLVTQKLVDSAGSALIPASFCRRLRPRLDVVDSRYLYFSLSNWWNQGGACEYQLQSTGIANFQFRVFSDNHVLGLPDLGMQRAIGEVLGALDDKIAANQRVIDAGDALIRALYSSTPKASKGRIFSDVAAIGGGGTPSTKNPVYWDGGVGWATPTDVTGADGPWLAHTIRSISEEGLKNCASPLYPEGSILMTSRATIGAVVVARKPMAVNQGFIVLNAVESEMQWWLESQVRARTVEFETWANGATFLEISRGTFKKLPVFECSPEDLGVFNRTAQAVRGRQSSCQEENSKLARTRDELLPLLMSGRITVKDAERAAEDVL